MGLKLNGISSKIEGIDMSTTTETVASNENRYSVSSGSGISSTYKATVSVTADFNSTDTVHISYVGEHFQEKTLTTTIGALQSNTRLDGSYLMTGSCSMTSCSFTGFFNNNDQTLIYSTLLVIVTRTKVLVGEGDIVLESSATIEGNLSVTGSVEINTLNVGSMTISSMTDGTLTIDECEDFDSIHLPELSFSATNTLPQIPIQWYQNDYRIWNWCPVQPNSFYLIQCKDKTSGSSKIMGGVFYIPDTDSYKYSDSFQQGVSMVNHGEAENARLLIYPTDNYGNDSSWSQVRGIKFGWASANVARPTMIYAENTVNNVSVYRLPISWDLFSFLSATSLFN